MTDPTSRMLRLLTLLQTHRFWPGEELAERLAVSPRTLRRDIDRLRELGYPVHAARGVAGGYQLQAGADLPPLVLDDEEAVAIAVGLRTAAGGSVAGIEETSLRALTKLERLLPTRLRRQVNAIGTYTVPLAFGSPDTTVDAGTLTVIAAACRDHERLQFDYTAPGREETPRAVEPHRLVSLGRRWYLVAWDVHRADWRTFRVDRLTAPRTSGARFSPRTLPAPDAAEFVRQSLRSRPRSYEADVTLHKPAEQAAELMRWFGGEISPRDDGSCRARLTGDSLGWMAAALGLMECDFEVHGPPELRDWLAAFAGRIGGA